MNKALSPCYFLTKTTRSAALLLTFTCAVLFSLPLLADNNTCQSYLVSYSIQCHKTEVDAEQNKRVGALIDRLRQEAPRLVPGLPSGLLAPTDWLASNMTDLVDFDATGTDNFSDIVVPLGGWFHAPEITTDQAMWIAPAYHHQKGVMPFNDSLILGVHSRYPLIDDYARVEVRPYYAQNYVSSRGYWGTDVTFDFRTPDETGHLNKPWGRIALGYAQGHDKLIEHGSGLDLKGELYFSDSLSLNSGVRRNDANGAGTYAILRWKTDLP